MALLRKGNFFAAACALLSLISSAVSAEEAPFRQRAHSHVLSVTTASDVEAEIRFGRDVAARVLGRLPLQQDEALTRYLNLVGTALATRSSRSDLRFHFALLDSDGINAYSAPGGYIFISRGALKLAQDEAELAGVLAHEIAHVSERHIVKALNIRAADTGGSVGVGRLLGGSSDTARIAIGQAVDQAVAILFESGYSQQDELESDQVATLLLASSGYDPLALRRYLERVQAQEQGSAALNTTHPPSQQRLRTLDRLIADENLDELTLVRNSTRFNRHVKQQ
jgi:beta-barrel assembly-enhancing protease